MSSRKGVPERCARRPRGAAPCGRPSRAGCDEGVVRRSGARRHVGVKIAIAVDNCWRSGRAPRAGRSPRRRNSTGHTRRVSRGRRRAAPPPPAAGWGARRQRHAVASGGPCLPNSQRFEIGLRAFFQADKASTIRRTARETCVQRAVIVSSRFGAGRRRRGGGSDRSARFRAQRGEKARQRAWRSARRLASMPAPTVVNSRTGAAFRTRGGMPRAPVRPCPISCTCGRRTRRCGQRGGFSHRLHPKFDGRRCRAGRLSPARAPWARGA